MNLTKIMERVGLTGLIVMATLGIIQWGGVDIRIVFGFTSISVLIIYVSLIVHSIHESYMIVSRFHTKKKGGKRNA